MRSIIYTEHCDYEVELNEHADETYTVRYGSAVSKRMSYEEATKELGACIMHSATCKGLIAPNCELEVPL